MMKEVDPMLKSKEIHPSNIELHNELGRGKFGVVYKATVNNLEGTTKSVQAAVKTSNEKADVEEREALVEEMKRMVQLGDHQNILPLLASCSVREPYYLVTVSMKYGDLLHFLRKCRQQKNKENDSTFRVGEEEKLMIALQIAKGMAYVREQRFYHGDLAARNILVGEGLEIKISDFGLSEDLYTKGYQRRTKGQMIPIKWCSLETILHGICSSDADVWSYGVVLYEIYTLGGTPYPGMEGRFLVPMLKRGYRMEQPGHCPDYVYEVMQRCWQEDPHERIKFQEIVEKMEATLVQMTDYVQFSSEDDIMINRPAPITGHDALPTDDHDEDNFAPILEEDDNININDLEDFMMIEGSSTTDHVIMPTRGVKNDYVES
ncbi:Proto-oncogene tyrosine-protein kinase receptor Ret [Holothuria leucospilota]|uniref:Proto-oncogene tyrosine-protein kinase receptor Ret n=1 Tax=Holothuria leucospilota TaxID=206669 RepID=A0A9Q1CNF9_HOLLE|nr:Proto-oncogene tyrosine-protein kinase receptor Ret [Holothuria leucospilota]